jgi:hypothetical protein
VSVISICEGGIFNDVVFYCRIRRDIRVFDDSRFGIAGREFTLMKYKVEIVEKLSIFFEEEASSAEEALGRVAKKYWNEEIIVESTQGPDVEFFVSPPKEGKILRLFRKLFR